MVIHAWVQGWVAGVHCSSMQGVHSMQRERSAAPWQTWPRVCVAPALSSQTKDPLLLTRCTDFDRSWACALLRHRVHCTRLCAGRSHAMPGRERVLRSISARFLGIAEIPYMECFSGGTTCRGLTATVTALKDPVSGSDRVFTSRATVTALCLY